MFCDFVGLLPLLSPARTCPACCPWWSKWVGLTACPRGSWTRPHSSSFSRSDQGIFFSNAELAIFWAEVRGPGANSRLIGLAPAPGKIGGSDFRLHNSNLYFWALKKLIIISYYKSFFKLNLKDAARAALKQAAPAPQHWMFSFFVFQRPKLVSSQGSSTYERILPYNKELTRPQPQLLRYLLTQPGSKDLINHVLSLKRPSKETPTSGNHHTTGAISRLSLSIFHMLNLKTSCVRITVPLK